MRRFKVVDGQGVQTGWGIEWCHFGDCTTQLFNGEFIAHWRTITDIHHENQSYEFIDPMPPIDMDDERAVYERRDRWLSNGSVRRDLTHEVIGGQHAVSLLDTVEGPLVNGNRSETSTLVADTRAATYLEALQFALDAAGAS